MNRCSPPCLWTNRYEYAYFEHGNWTDKREFKAETRDGNEVLVPGVVWYPEMRNY